MNGQQTGRAQKLGDAIQTIQRALTPLVDAGLPNYQRFLVVFIDMLREYQGWIGADWERVKTLKGTSVIITSVGFGKLHDINPGTRQMLVHGTKFDGTVMEGWLDFGSDAIDVVPVPEAVLLQLVVQCPTCNGTGSMMHPRWTKFYALNPGDEIPPAVVQKYWEGQGFTLETVPEENLPCGTCQGHAKVLETVH